MEKKKNITLCNLCYRIISPSQQIENDKSRLLTKFNFNISSNISTSTICHTKESINSKKKSLAYIKTEQHNKEKLKIDNINNINSNNKNKKSLSINTNKIKYKPKINPRDTNSSTNTNIKQIDIKSNNNELINLNTNKEEENNSIKAIKEDESYTVREEYSLYNSSFSESSKNDNINKNDKNEILFLYNLHLQKSEKNISDLNEDDNNKHNNESLNNDSKFHFIEDVINKNNKYIFLSFEKLKKIKTRPKFIIFSYLYDDYKKLMNISRSFRILIMNTLYKKYQQCFDSFKSHYKDLFSIEKYFFNLYEFSNNNSKNFKNSNFCLFIKAKILPNNIYIKKYGDVSFEMSYNYKIKSIKNDSIIYHNNSFSSPFNSYISLDHLKEEFIQIYKIDLHKSKNYPMWICSEKNEFFNSKIKNESKNFKELNDIFQKHILFTTPVVNINENDYIIFRFDLIGGNHVIEEIYFNQLLYEKIENNNNYFHKNIYKQDRKFDGMRDCEIEIQVNIWHDKLVINKSNSGKIYFNEFIDIIKHYFEKIFDIENVVFDVSKFIFTRFTLKAKKIGILKSNFFCNKDIEIVESDEILCKECVSVNCVNTFSLSEKIMIRKGTIVDFYFVEYNEIKSQ